MIGIRAAKVRVIRDAEEFGLLMMLRFILIILQDVTYRAVIKSLSSQGYLTGCFQPVCTKLIG